MIYALRDLAVEVDDGELLVLVGPSGCGKTTTLRMVAGLDEPTAGRVFIDNQDVTDVAPKNRDVAMVFQSYALYPHMTVFNNMAFGLKVRRSPRADIRRRVTEAAEKLGLVHLLDRKPAALSGGERQRVALGRAIVRRPKVYLLDEPLSNLDAKLRVKMRTEIRSLHRSLGTTMIYVTHDQEEAMTLGDRVAVMDKGLLQQCAPPMDIYRAPANRFVAEFFGTPSMNFMTGYPVERNGILNKLDIGFCEWTLTPDSALWLRNRGHHEVTLGVRPEHVQVFSGDAPTGSSTATATVDAVEPLGDVANVHLRTGNGLGLVARTSSSRGFARNEKVSIGFDPLHVYYFEPGPAGVRIPVP